jgi:two-component sensor histidine kinase
MFKPLIAVLKARKDRKNLLKRVEALEFAIEQMTLERDNDSLSALDLLTRVEAKLDGRKGGRPKKEETETDISKSILLTADGNLISKA